MQYERVKAMIEAWTYGFSRGTASGDDPWQEKAPLCGAFMGRAGLEPCVLRIMSYAIGVDPPSAEGPFRA